jgi:hypothetical protein
VPWRRGAVDIESALGIRRPGFKSRQGKIFNGKTYVAMLLCINDLICIACVLKRRNKGIGHKKEKFQNKRQSIHVILCFTKLSFLKTSPMPTANTFQM